MVPTHIWAPAGLADMSLARRALPIFDKQYIKPKSQAGFLW